MWDSNKNQNGSQIPHVGSSKTYGSSGNFICRCTTIFRPKFCMEYFFLSGSCIQHIPGYWYLDPHGSMITITGIRSLHNFFWLISFVRKVSNFISVSGYVICSFLLLVKKQVSQSVLLMLCLYYTLRYSTGRPTILCWDRINIHYTVSLLSLRRSNRD